jgi:hypothetical protein
VLFVTYYFGGGEYQEMWVAIILGSLILLWQFKKIDWFIA